MVSYQVLSLIRNLLESVSGQVLPPFRGEQLVRTLQTDHLAGYFLGEPHFGVVGTRGNFAADFGKLPTSGALVTSRFIKM